MSDGIGRLRLLMLVFAIGKRPRAIFRDGSGADDRPWRPVLFGSIAEYRSEEHTSELQSLMRLSYAVFCLKKKTTQLNNIHVSSNQMNTLLTSVIMCRLRHRRSYNE